VTKEELFKWFGSKEWELLCSKVEFLNVFVAEPFNAEHAEEVANKILEFDSH